ncbi:hypothetical protein [Clostridium autoethanogenum]|uniref:Peptidase M50 n=1 Tax=Clostridium autoethanogenum DSM 10061 TaxID=1341692 RepID=A0ABN4BAK3_9CLOT|nr:hypothetical protein [Clostridium autoethanogenum]AGY74609.1 hypothetical protein CAETHG_0380 [Clostridium autoethanogenum DSM 10061]ALU34794.1 putative membrane protein [Clostridium autoethanogenum DSM 10061]OVY51513.1 hypothetical protein WX72_01646 [Clostridium autoethanogenum]
MSIKEVNMDIDSRLSKLVFLAITLIATPIHEFGHFIGFELSGIPAKFVFSYTEPKNGLENLWGCLGGPAINLILAVIGCIIVYIFRNREKVYIGMYFAITMCLTRLIAYLLFIIINPYNMFPINDEGLIAKFLNVPIWQVYGFFIAVFILLLLILRSIKKDYFYKCFKYAFAFYFFIDILFAIRIY